MLKIIFLDVIPRAQSIHVPKKTKFTVFLFSNYSSRFTVEFCSSNWYSTTQLDNKIPLLSDTTLVRHDHKTRFESM